MSSQPQERRFSGIEWLLLILLAIAGFELRAWGIARESLSPDDAWAVKTALMDPCGLIQTAIESGQNPLFCLLLHFWIKLTGSAETQVRMLSVLIGTMTILVTAQLGKKIHSPAAGIAAAAFLCVSMFQIHVSHDVRTYALLNFLVTLSMLSAWDLVNENRWLSFFGYLLSGLLILLAHNLGLFALLAQNIFLVLLHGRSITGMPFFKRWLSVQCLIALAVLAWIGPLSTQFANIARGGDLSWLPTPSLQTFGLFLLQFAGATTCCNSFVQERLDHSSAIATCLLLFLLSAAAIVKIRFSPKAPDENEPLAHRFPVLSGSICELSLQRPDIHAFLFCWLFVPLVAAFAISQSPLHIFVPKPLGFASIPIFLWAGIGLSQIRNSAIQYIIFIAVIIISLSSFTQYHSTNTECDWRKATAYIEANSAAGDLVFLDIWYSHLAFNYYQHRADLVIQPFPFREGDITTESIARLKAAFAGKSSVWLVRSHSLDFDEYSVQVLRRMLKPVEEQHWFGIRALKFAVPGRE